MKQRIPAVSLCSSPSWKLSNTKPGRNCQSEIGMKELSRAAIRRNHFLCSFACGCNLGICGDGNMWNG